VHLACSNAQKSFGHAIGDKNVASVIENKKAYRQSV